ASTPSIITRTPPPPSLSPYTTLFRSYPDQTVAYRCCAQGHLRAGPDQGTELGHGVCTAASRRCPGPRGLPTACGGPTDSGAGVRSEEHTFELQSRENLVCRLLLEKKK